MGVESTWNQDLQDDLHAWLDDINAGLHNSSFSIDEIENSIITINEGLPPFVKNWTVAELIYAVKLNLGLR